MAHITRRRKKKETRRSKQQLDDEKRRDESRYSPPVTPPSHAIDEPYTREVIRFLRPASRTTTDLSPDASGSLSRGRRSGSISLKSLLLMEQAASAVPSNTAAGARKDNASQVDELTRHLMHHRSESQSKESHRPVAIEVVRVITSPRVHIDDAAHCAVAKAVSHPAVRAARVATIHPYP
jgi:hypothetical protein